MIRRLAPVLTTSVLVAGAAAPARAGGFFVGENGAQAAQRAGAFIAKSDDATALYHNPAGLMKTRKFEVVVGTNVMHMEQTIDRSGVYAVQDGVTQPAYVGEELPAVSMSATKAIPSLFASQRIGNRLAIGEGVFAPHGIPNRTYDDEVQLPGVTTPTTPAPNPVRYDVLQTEAIMLIPSLGMAARVTDKIDIGLRAGWGFGNIKTRTFLWAVGNEAEDPGYEGDFRLEAADAFMPNLGAGILVRPATWIELGAAWFGPLAFDGKGSGQAILGAKASMPLPGANSIVEPIPDDERPNCAPGGTAANLKTCLTLGIPQRATIGGRLIKRAPDGSERGDIELDIRWENHGGVSDPTLFVDGRDSLSGRRLQKVVIPHGHQDVYSIRLGGAWTFPIGKNSLEARGGISYDTAAAPTSWTRGDIDSTARASLATGVGYSWSRYRIDAGFSVTASPTVTVERVAIATPEDEASRRQPDPAQPLDTPTQQEYHPINEGTYENLYVAGLFGFSTWF